MDSLKRAGGAWLLAAMLLAGCAAPPAVKRDPATGNYLPVSRFPYNKPDLSSSSSLTPTALEHLACDNHSNITAPSSEFPYYWRLIMNFNAVRISGIEKSLLCFEVRNTSDLSKFVRDIIECDVKGDSPSLNTSQVWALIEPSEIAALGLEPRKINQVDLNGNTYIQCTLDMNARLSAAFAKPELGVTATLSDVYSYRYFSISALANLEPTAANSGALVAIRPACQGRPECLPTS